MRRIAVMAVISTTIVLLLLSQGAVCKKLNVIILNEDLEIINEIYEGETFLVYVSDPDDPSQPVDNYTIHFNNKDIFFGRDDPNYPFSYIKAPDVNQDKTFSIMIEKEGYESSEIIIVVKNRGELFVKPSSFSLHSNQKLVIQVEDENGKPVEGATAKLYLGSSTYTSETDTYGKATFSVPVVNTKTTARIEVSKKGFEDAVIEGTILPPQTDDNIFNSRLIQVVVTAVAIISVFALGIRHIKLRERMYEEDDIAENKEKIWGINRFKKEEKPINVKNPKIEEIIVGPPEKHISTAKRSYIPVTSPPHSKTKEPDTWVVGDRDTQRKIYEKFGLKEEKKKDLDKWLTGREDIIARIDEKLKEIEEKKRKTNPSEDRQS